jgi:hypothetical protein
VSVVASRRTIDSISWVIALLPVDPGLALGFRDDSLCPLPCATNGLLLRLTGRWVGSGGIGLHQGVGSRVKGGLRSMTVKVTPTQTKTAPMSVPTETDSPSKRTPRMMPTTGWKSRRTPPRDALTC